MTLGAGSRLGVYEVSAKIGEGGMGDVYQARDTTLDRDVALKVLPEAFTADPDRLARFEREAKVLASLNHPNIGSIYGLEEADGGKSSVNASHTWSQPVFIDRKFPEWSPMSARDGRMATNGHTSRPPAVHFFP